MDGNGNHPPLDTLSHRSVEMVSHTAPGKDRHHLGASGWGLTKFSQKLDEKKSLVKH